MDSAQLLQRADRVFPRHLLAPVHDEVSVVERAGFDVSGFGGGWMWALSSGWPINASPASVISIGDGAMPPRTSLRIW